MSNEAGIAIGPILFVIAILGVLAMVLSTDRGGLGTAIVADRVTADIQSQANLIRTKIDQCNLQYASYAKLQENANASFIPLTDQYPSSDTTNGTVVSSLLCDPMGTQNIWFEASVPQPTAGFGRWLYINASSSGGGRCIWTMPTIANPANNSGLVEGLKKAAAKFTNQTSCSNAVTCGATEAIYNPVSSSQKFVVWITIPTGSPDSHCLP